ARLRRAGVDNQKPVATGQHDNVRSCIDDRNPVGDLLYACGRARLRGRTKQRRRPQRERPCHRSFQYLSAIHCLSLLYCFALSLPVSRYRAHASRGLAAAPIQISEIAPVLSEILSCSIPNLCSTVRSTFDKGARCAKSMCWPPCFNLPLPPP